MEKLGVTFNSYGKLHIAEGDYETARKDGILTRCGRFVNGWKVQKWDDIRWRSDICPMCEKAKPRSDRQTKKSIQNAATRYLHNLENEVEHLWKKRTGIKVYCGSQYAVIKPMGKSFQCEAKLTTVVRLEKWNLEDKIREKFEKVQANAVAILGKSLEERIKEKEITVTGFKVADGQYAHVSIELKFTTTILSKGDPNYLVESSFKPMKAQMLKFMFLCAMASSQQQAAQQALELAVSGPTVYKDNKDFERLETWRVFTIMNQVGWLKPVIDELYFPLHPEYGLNRPKEETDVTD